MDNKYTGFAVLTQTCDLARRNNEACKSSYINVAVVRPLEHVLLTFLDKCCHRDRLAPGVYLSTGKNAATSFLERLLDQNEQSMGLFYLHPDGEADVLVPSVIMLQVSVALRAAEHYETIVNARTGRLRVEFRNKLGWLLGNLYARVPTRDFGEEVRNAIIKDLLSPAAQQSWGPQWISKKNLKKMQASTAKPWAELAPQDLRDLLQKHQAPPAQNAAIERVEATVRSVIPDISDDQVKHIARTLRNDLKFEAAFK